MTTTMLTRGTTRAGFPAPTVSSDPVQYPPVTVRTWKGRQVGDASDAGRLCATPQSPEGVSGDVYQYYVRRLDAPRPVVGYRDPDTGRLVYDLDEVRRWHASRKGQGYRSDLDTGAGGE